MIKEKYYGTPDIDRKADITTILKKDHFYNNIFFLSGKSGDMYLFSCNQMHRANPPDKEFRDVATFMIIPTDKNKNYEINYNQIQTEYNFSNNPWLEINKH